jgi:hypothetical protein
MAWFEYPVTRPYTLRHFNVTLVALGTIWITFVIIISIAAVGYEQYSFASELYNVSRPLWYEKMFLASNQWLPGSRVCDASLIKTAESNVSLQVANGSRNNVRSVPL